MGLSTRDKKRILIFLIIPLLLLVPIFSGNLTLKIIAGIVLVIYVGFIIFLRDSIRIKEIFENDDDLFIAVDDDEEEPSGTTYETDAGEDFQIISGSTNVETMKIETYTQPVRTGKKILVKPENLKESFEKIAFEKVPEGVNHDEQFVFVLEKLLSVIKETFLAHSVVFYWYNKRKHKLTLEKFVTDSTSFREEDLEIENDILSKIVLKEEPELLTDILASAEADVIRYYDGSQGIKSFVGVPLFYNKMLTGVLALDSKAKDNFGIETIYHLGRFVRVIAIIISLFEERFTDSKSQERLNALLKVIEGSKKFDDENDLYEIILKTVEDLIPWDVFTFVFFDPVEQKFKILKSKNKKPLKYVGENLEVQLERTLVGKAILTGVPVSVEDTSDKKYIRFSENEDVHFDGSFLAVPLIYDNQNYGVLCFENLKKNIYTNSDIRFMKTVSKLFSFMVYSFSTNSILKKLLSVDVETRALNYDTFIERMENDLIKANDVKVPSAIALIQIDEFLDEGTLFEEDPFPKVLMEINEMIKSEITKLELFGRLQERIFGVYFFNKTTKDVFLWAEKLRIKIARKPIAVLSKQTTFTVSIGVASAQGKTDVHEVLHNAELALNKALEKGGNSVKSIN